LFLFGLAGTFLDRLLDVYEQTITVFIIALMTLGGLQYLNASTLFIVLLLGLVASHLAM
jgi:hypothetical protein